MRLNIRKLGSQKPAWVESEHTSLNTTTSANELNTYVQHTLRDRKSYLRFEGIPTYDYSFEDVECSDCPIPYNCPRRRQLR